MLINTRPFWVIGYPLYSFEPEVRGLERHQTKLPVSIVSVWHRLLLKSAPQPRALWQAFSSGNHVGTAVDQEVDQQRGSGGAIEMASPNLARLALKPHFLEAAHSADRASWFTLPASCSSAQVSMDRQAKGGRQKPLLPSMGHGDCGLTSLAQSYLSRTQRGSMFGDGTVTI